MTCISDELCCRNLDKLFTSTDSCASSTDQNAHYSPQHHYTMPLRELRNGHSSSATYANIKAPKSTGSATPSSSCGTHAYGVKAPRSTGSATNNYPNSKPPQSSVGSNQPRSCGSTPSRHGHMPSSGSQSVGEPLRAAVSSQPASEENQRIQISALDLNASPSPTTQALLLCPSVSGVNNGVNGVSGEAVATGPPSAPSILAPAASASEAFGKQLGGDSEAFSIEKLNVFTAVASGPRSDHTVGSRHRGGGGLICESSMSSLSPRESHGASLSLLKTNSCFIIDRYIRCSRTRSLSVVWL